MKAFFLALSFFASLAPASSIHDFKVKSIDEEEVDLSEYRGKVLLVVNTASKCGFTPQYKGLQKLYDQYKDKGLVVMGFPSNDFKEQEPAANADIKNFCELNYGVTFPLFEKAPVTGKHQQPIFQFLTRHGPFKGIVQWNFEKFLLDRQGNVVSRFRSRVKPEDRALRIQIEKLLAQ